MFWMYLIVVIDKTGSFFLSNFIHYFLGFSAQWLFILTISLFFFCVFILNWLDDITHRGICPQNHFAPLVSRLWGQTGCQKKQKTSRNSNFLVWCATFQSKLKNLQKRPKLNQKHEKNAIFWAVFWNLCNFDWKVAHQTKKFEFLEVLCFFWHPVCPQRRETSGDIPIWTFCFENLTTVVPSRIFFVFFKIKSEACFTGLRLKKGYYYTF